MNSGNERQTPRVPPPPRRLKPARKPSDHKPPNNPPKKINVATLINADNDMDEWTKNITSPQSVPIISPTRTRRFGYPTGPPAPPPPSMQNRHQSLSPKSANEEKNLKKRNSKKQKSKSELPTKKEAKKRWGWPRSRNSEPTKKTKEKLKNRSNRSLSPNGKQNLIIRVNHINKSDKASKNAKSKVIFEQGDPSQNQILGDILIHCLSWNQLKNIQTDNKKSKKNKTWKTVYCILDTQTIKFYEPQQNINKNNDDQSEDENKESECIMIYLSEILTLTRSIRSVDGQKYIIELNVCGKKVLISFGNIEQREYWHSLLSDYHLNYFVWRSTPLDEHKRTSQNVINGVHKLIKKNVHKSDESDTLNILYIEQILSQISSLNISKIIDLVPCECQFMASRLIRVITSIKFFFMSALKSLSGADIPLPSRCALIDYLNEIENVKWTECTPQILDFYCDYCYRILFSLSFAFCANARDEIMRMNYKENNKQKNEVESNVEEKQMSELKFEYESLQRSWKMHRDRLQEYVMAYRDAVAKLKHSYHQRDSLCKKIDNLTQEKEKLNDSLSHQNKTFNATMQEAQKLTEKFALLSKQMDNMQLFNQQPIIGNFNQYQINNNTMSQPMQVHGTGYPQFATMQQQSAPIFGANLKKQQSVGNNNNVNNNGGGDGGKHNDNNPRHQMQQISQEMSNLFIKPDQ